MTDKPNFIYYCYTGPNIPISKKIFTTIEECIKHCILIKSMRDPKITERQAMKEIHVVKIDPEICLNRHKIFKNIDGIHPPLPKISKKRKKRKKQA